jgi:hypothetical protein
VGLAWAGLVLASFWTIGADDEWDAKEPWLTLSFVAAVVLGAVGRRWRLLLLALLLLPVGYVGPEMGEERDGNTLSDWWWLAGPLWAVVHGTAIAAGTGAGKLRERRIRRDR